MADLNRDDPAMSPCAAPQMNRLKRVWSWIDDRAGITEVIWPVLAHLAPRDSRWYYVFGTATATAFMLQVITGIALALSYIPSTAEAYDTLQFITHQAPFGGILRGMHYFGASAMMVMIGAHMAQTFLMGCYKYPREMNWITGVILFAVTIAMAFTGQLLRWDQTAVWSILVSAEIAARIPIVGPWLAHFLLAGDTWGGQTLSRFFSFHVFWIPALIFAFIGVHVWLVLRHGVSEPPKAGRPVDPRTYRAWYHEMMQREGVPFFPDSAWRDVLFAVGLIAVVAVLAVLVGAPELGKPPDPSLLASSPRPDWYLLWTFSLFALLPPSWENYFIVIGPALAAIILFIIPLWNRGERSPTRRPWAIASVITICLMVGSLWIVGITSPWSPDFAARPLPQSVVGAAAGPVAIGANLFYNRGCEFCHAIAGQGGRRGPDLTTVGDRLTPAEMTWRILNGGTNMPAFAGHLTPDQVDALIAFLKSRTAQRQRPP